MLKEPFQVKRQKQRLFQSVFLSNSKSQEVMVVENDFVDFGEILKHLENGGSIFITSKPNQKLLFGEQDECKSRRPRRKEVD
jgi:hypothetical protein